MNTIAKKLLMSGAVAAMSMAAMVGTASACVMTPGPWGCYLPTLVPMRECRTVRMPTDASGNGYRTAVCHWEFE